MLSQRLRNIADALPIKPGSRVLEIGCGTGAMTRALAAQMQTGFVLGIDRSAKAIELANLKGSDDIQAGVLNFRNSSIEEFKLAQHEIRFDIAVAIRVGVLDGRHPDKYDLAIASIRNAVVPNGALYIDGGDPLQQLPIWF